MAEVTCSMCGATVEESTAYRKITGWERQRKQGGTNAVALRKLLPEWACDPCVWKLKRGIDPTQGSIF